MHLLSNYTIDARTRYEGHTLFYTPENADPIELRGILGAAILDHCTFAPDADRALERSSYTVIP